MDLREVLLYQADLAGADLEGAALDESGLSEAIERSGAPEDAIQVAP